MAPTKAWETIPSADFASKLNWRSLGENRYAALRVRLLILQTNGSEIAVWQSYARGKRGAT